MSAAAAMPDESMRTVLVSLGAGLGITLAMIVAAVFTGSAASAALAARPTSSIPWGTGGKPTPGR